MIEIAAMIASQFGDRGIRAFSVAPGTVLTEQVAAAISDGTFDADAFTPPENTAPRSPGSRPPRKRWN